MEGHYNGTSLQTGSTSRTLPFFSKEISKERQYVTALYTAVLMLGSNEIGPVSIIELLTVVIIMIVTSLINAIIFGEMAVLITII